MTAIRALNKVLDEGIKRHPLLEQQMVASRWRQSGMGIMGLADMLIKMKITYGSDEALKICDDIGTALAKTAILTSGKLAEQFGNYPNFTTDIYESNFYKAHFDKPLPYGLYNSQLLTIAPTGTLSTLLGISGGIEPIFANSYTRTTKSLEGGEKDYKVYTPIVQQYMEANNLSDDTQLPDYFVTSAMIPVENRLAMQSIWQKHIDASISSTINLPESATIEDVEHLYSRAWAYGLKGITIFRSGCKRTAILNTKKEKKEEPKHVVKIEDEESKRGIIIPTSDNLIGLQRKLTIGCGVLHCQCFFDYDSGEFREIYLSKGSNGGCNNYMIGLSRMISLAARGGVPIEAIIDQLMSCGSCPSYASRTALKHDTSRGSSCPVAIGYAIADMNKEFQDTFMYAPSEKVTLKVPPKDSGSPKCPECGADLIFEGGCNICKSCGWSKCN